MVRVCTYRLFLVVVFLRPDVQLQRSGGELVEGRRELKAVLEQRHPGEDVEAQSGSGHGHHQTPHIPVGGGGDDDEGKGLQERGGEKRAADKGKAGKDGELEEKERKRERKLEK